MPNPPYTPPHLAPELAGYEHKPAREKAMRDEWFRLLEQAEREARAQAEPRHLRRAMVTIAYRDTEGRYTSHGVGSGDLISAIAGIVREGVWWLGLEVNMVEDLAVEEGGRPALWMMASQLENAVEQAFTDGRLVTRFPDEDRARKNARKREVRASVRAMLAEEAAERAG